MGYFGTPTRIVCDQDPSIYVTPMSVVFYTHIVYMSPQPAPPITSALWLNMALKI